MGDEQADRAGRPGGREDLGEAGGELVVALSLLDAEDGAQDDLEGYRLHRRVERERLALAPPRDRVSVASAITSS